MKNKLTIGLFICAVVIQIITPVSMIVKREIILRSGEQFKFKTRPVDPFDAFRGRYVALSVEAANLPRPKGAVFQHGQKVYASIAVDEQGFAKFSDAVPSRPKSGPYILAKVRYPSGSILTLELPFDRYYMEEKSAPRAEKIYREYSSRDKQDAYILVRVKNGAAVVEGLYVGGRRIEEAVKATVSH